jgi:hypothetical protein
MNSRNLFFNVDDGGAGGGPTADVFDGGETPSTEVETPPATPEVPPSSTPAFDPNKFAQDFAREVGAVVRSTPQQQPPPMTQEEARKAMNFFEFTPEFFVQLDNLDTRQKAFETLRDGFIRFADSITQARLHDMQEALEKKYGPVLEFKDTYEAERRETRFYSAYPGLKEPKLRSLIAAVAGDLKARGAVYGSEEEQFKALASGVEAVIKVHNPAFTLNGAAGAGQPQTPRGGIPVTSPGSGGVSGSKGAGPAKSKGLAIFDS